MKLLKLMLFAFLCFGSIACQAQTNGVEMKTEKEIKKVIGTFVKAGEERNVSMYSDILHTDFRVIANRFPTPEKTSIIPAKSYIAMISKEVIGGTEYQIKYKDIYIAEHSATVRVELIAEKSRQLVTFLLIQNSENKWQIIADMATQAK